MNRLRSILVLAALPAAMPMAPAPPPAAPHLVAPVEPACATASPRTPPSASLLDAFPLLRRERGPGDALPADALAALKAHGLEPVDPGSARLLATTPSGGRTWLVPVPDVTRASPMACPPFAPGRARIPPPRRPAPAAPPRRSAPAPRVPPPAPRRPARPVAPGAAPPLRAQRAPGRPRQGVAAVALGDGPLPAGGALDDLVRGRAQPAVDGCAGPRRTMLAVHGLVPAGVREAFLTQPDGTAIRSEARDGLVSFVVPRPRDPAPRYLVWTGADGTPHVQVVPYAGPYGAAVRRPCPVLRGGPPRVTPLGPPCPPGPAPAPARGPVPFPICLVASR